MPTVVFPNGAKPVMGEALWLMKWADPCPMTSPLRESYKRNFYGPKPIELPTKISFQRCHTKALNLRSSFVESALFGDPSPERSPRFPRRCISNSLTHRSLVIPNLRPEKNPLFTRSAGFAALYISLGNWLQQVHPSPSAVVAPDPSK